VQFTPRLTNQPDKIDLDVEVEEKSTAKVNFGVGYSTAEKSVIGQTSITEENLFGKGQKLNLGLMRAEKRFDIDLSFTEPYFLGKELSAGFDVFRTTTDSRKNFTPFDSKTIGFSPNIGYDISEYLRHMLRYGFKKEKISIHGDISNISYYIKEQAGINTVSSIGQTFFYDRTDNRLETTKGFFIKLDQEFTGLGGNTKFLKHQINGSYYIPLSRNNESWVLKLSANAGHILPYGKQKEVRINERFFVGDTGLHGLRGFDSGGIGPRLKTDPNKSRGRGDPIGGNVYYTATTELAFPLGLPKELDMSGSLFTDIGSLFSFSKAHTLKSGEKIDVWHDRSLRMAAGVGLLWKTRMGTIRFDFAQPILKRKYDRTKYFHFNLSTNF
jgi:outer membrane protein insertion porin family